MPWKPLLWRTAVRLEAAYARRRAPLFGDPLHWDAWSELVAGIRRRDKAARRGWRYARMREHETLQRELEHLLSNLRVLRGSFLLPQVPRLPGAAELYAELAAAEAEFGAVVEEDYELFVTTEPISLEGIDLGPFEIRLDLRRLEEPEPYRIVAVDPRPAHSSSETVHPHVHAQRICLGEGKPAVAAALAEGRLGDLFQLVHRVLQTYGEGSAYVPLDRWCGSPCADCDDAIDEEEGYSCYDCDGVVCGGCVRSCRYCDRSACHECATVCYSCEETVCGRCLERCEQCGEDFCSECLTEGVCDACREAEEEEPAGETEDAGAESQPAIHADGLGETAVLARPRHHRNRRLRNLGRR
ncbi:MAG: hypothetical protein C0483_11195 [Pirellula sp.]|nr:hypothetical protein [Pirellula sp.]